MRRESSSISCERDGFLERGARCLGNLCSCFRCCCSCCCCSPRWCNPFSCSLLLASLISSFSFLATKPSSNSLGDPSESREMICSRLSGPSAHRRLRARGLFSLLGGLLSRLPNARVPRASFLSLLGKRLSSPRCCDSRGLRDLRLPTCIHEEGLDSCWPFGNLRGKGERVALRPPLL